MLEVFESVIIQSHQQAVDGRCNSDASGSSRFLWDTCHQVDIRLDGHRHLLPAALHDLAEVGEDGVRHCGDFLESPAVAADRRLGRESSRGFADLIRLVVA